MEVAESSPSCEGDGTELLAQLGRVGVRGVGDAGATNGLPAARETELILLDAVGIDADGARVNAENETEYKRAASHRSAEVCQPRMQEGPDALNPGVSEEFPLPRAPELPVELRIDTLVVLDADGHDVSAGGAH